MNKFFRVFYVTAALFSFCAAETLNPKTLAGFGSSVCSGQKAAKGSAYIDLLRNRLAQDGWAVTNVSRGGDSTVTIQTRWQPMYNGNGVQTNTGPFLLTAKPSYVLISLSLGNEKWNDTQFKSNLPGLISACRSHGMMVAVAGCYSHGAMDAARYAQTRQVNLFVGQLDVPSINFFGSVDDGAGRWASGFQFGTDALHPNTAGHGEMFHAIVPTLWQALEQGKPIPERTVGEGHSLSGQSLEFISADPVHAFAEVFWVKASADGAIASIDAFSVSATNTPERQFTPATEQSAVSLAVANGRLLYAGLGTNRISAAVSNGWNMVAISHWYARGETELYVNGVKAGSVQERCLPVRFTLNGADFRDWFIYRSALNSDEVALLNGGGMYKSSLEVYAPLNAGDLTNCAQSLSEITLHGF